MEKNKYNDKNKDNEKPGKLTEQMNHGIEKLEKIEHDLNENENKMGVLPINKLIWSMSLPAMISMFINALYNIVDSMFVARISESALAAVTLVFPIQMLIVSVGVGTGVGINSLIARRLGAKRQDEANSAADHGYILGIFSWVIFAIFGLFFSKPFIGMFTQDTYILENASLYMTIVTSMSLFAFVTVVTEKVLQATGNMLFPMIFNILGAVVNVILDPILIFGWFGFPKMGVSGAAIATIIGQFCAMAIALFMLLHYDHHVKISYSNFKLKWKTVKDIYFVGIPTIIMLSIGSVMTTFLNGILIKFSATAVAVLGVYFRLNSFIFMPVFGLNQGTLPIIGFNYGAKSKDRMMATYKGALKIAIVVMAIGTAIFWIFTKQLFTLFNATPEMLEIGIPALRIISICFVSAAYSIITTGMFQALAHGFLSMMVALLRQLILVVPLTYFLTLKFGLEAAWYSFPIAEVGSTIITIIFFRYIYNKEIKPLGGAK